MTAQELIDKLQTLIKAGAIQPTDTIMMAAFDEEEHEFFFEDVETLSWDGGCSSNLFICNHDYIFYGDDAEIDFKKSDFGIES